MADKVSLVIKGSCGEQLFTLDNALSTMIFDVIISTHSSLSLWQHLIPNVTQLHLQEHHIASSSLSLGGIAFWLGQPMGCIAFLLLNN